MVLLTLEVIYSITSICVTSFVLFCGWIVFALKTPLASGSWSWLESQLTFQFLIKLIIIFSHKSSPRWTTYDQTDHFRIGWSLICYSRVDHPKFIRAINFLSLPDWNSRCTNPLPCKHNVNNNYPMDIFLIASTTLKSIVSQRHALLRLYYIVCWDPIL